MTLRLPIYLLMALSSGCVDTGVQTLTELSCHSVEISFPRIAGRAELYRDGHLVGVTELDGDSDDATVEDAWLDPEDSGAEHSYQVVTGRVRMPEVTYRQRACEPESRHFPVTFVLWDDAPQDLNSAVLRGVLEDVSQFYRTESGGLASVTFGNPRVVSGGSLREACSRPNADGSCPAGYLDAPMRPGVTVYDRMIGGYSDQGDGIIVGSFLTYRTLVHEVGHSLRLHDGYGRGEDGNVWKYQTSNPMGASETPGPFSELQRAQLGWPYGSYERPEACYPSLSEGQNGNQCDAIVGG